MKKPATLTALAVLGGLTLSTAAVAFDRAPNAAERASIEEALTQAGFASWEEIELDDDGPYWEVDDARTPDGKRYDLKLQPRTFQIVERDLED